MTTREVSWLDTGAFATILSCIACFSKQMCSRVSSLGGEEVRSVESFVVLDDGSAIRDRAMDATMSRLYGMDAQSVYVHNSLTARLKDSNSPAEITTILMEIWKPNGVHEDFNEEVVLQQGCIINIDEDEASFLFENFLKKLLALIVQKKTGFIAKTAAIDVFSWICSLESVLANP